MFHYPYDRMASENLHSSVMEHDEKYLFQFVSDSRDFLDRLISHRAAFVPGIAESLHMAWVHSLGRWQEILMTISAQWWQKKDLLSAYGLVGAELRSKLQVVEHHFGDLISEVVPGALGRLLQTINALLDSILQVFGLSSMIKEIKDAIPDALQSTGQIV